MKRIALAAAFAFAATAATAQQRVPTMMLCGPEGWAMSILEEQKMVQATGGVLAGGQDVLQETWVNPETNDWVNLRRKGGAVCFTGRGYGWSLGTPEHVGDPS